MSYQVLVVDDSAAMRGFIRRVLDLSGFEVGQVFEAADGLDALAVLEEHPIDVVLTDINMPRMDGEELMLHLREDEDLQDVPVLVLSADSSEARMSRMFAAGARGYLGKPLSPERLRAELDRVLGVCL
jgi:two-component system, chemotaxis family, chemotaxis protein CheY